MRKFVTMAVGVAMLCGAAAFAQTPPPPTTPPATVTPEEHMARAHQEAAWLHRALREGKHDPATLQLMTKALTDRTAVLQAELDHVTKLQALVTALQGGGEEAIKTARENAKTSHEAVATAAKVFFEDIKAIRDHIKSTRPEHHRREKPADTPPAAPSN